MGITNGRGSGWMLDNFTTLAGATSPTQPVRALKAILYIHTVRPKDHTMAAPKRHYSKKRKQRAAPPSAQQKGLAGLKKAIMDEGNNVHYKDWQKELLEVASTRLEGMAKDIASNALKYKRISEKQAFCVAMGLIESGHVHPLRYAEV